ncbi:nitrate reductase molybdenum cofactor assembly chaperone [Desulfotomaculum copahuensis]|uniref:Nitrate reductase molybdenum cofactor assembly chaperone n=1 Tax=Desulfotomaculum copahuensis TaxID=1838280 RepID=A0A1B7LHZ8_9FIRM|nr:nitrate reductase molybdenum cofactor assembly chaperone [Desulfotomaculum copahuensis]OAT85878.1 nitrate reductase molybdenum cofactor assembly chaperone [Desulfotomaculum copahuensis]
MKKETARRIFRLASLLFQYPDEHWWKELADLHREMTVLPDGPAAGALARFMDIVTRTDRPAFSQAYVETFDFGRQAGLYLTCSRYGDERQRGDALLALKQQYARAGLVSHLLELFL